MRRALRRLLFVTDAPGFGGAERYILDMAGVALRRGITPHIFWPRITVSDPGTFSSVGGLQFGITPVEPMQTRSLRGLHEAFTTTLDRQRPDALIINACGRPRFWTLTWAARQRGIPVVWVHHMVEGRDHRRLPPQWLGGRMEGLALWRVPQALRHRLAAAAATAVITSNMPDRESIIRWQGVPAAKILVIPPGVDCDRFRFDPSGRERLRAEWLRDIRRANPRAEEPFVVGTAVRLVPGKGADRLIEGICLLSRECPRILAVIAGAGPQREALAALAGARGISGRIRFVDFLPEMRAFYSALDAFALCSESESFGLALTEAMACQRAVVATPTAGARLQIEHGRSGLQLVGFSPVELSKALVRLDRDPLLRESMGRQGRLHVLNHFSADLAFDRTLEVLSGAGRDSIEPQEPSPLPAIIGPARGVR